MRSVTILAAAMMLGGGALPWVEAQVAAGFGAGAGVSFVPYEAIPEAWARDGIDLPREIAILAGSFVLAAVSLLTTLVGRTHRGATVLAGALPLGYVAWRLSQAEEQLGGVGLDLSDLRGGVERLWPALSEIAAPGLYVYWAGAVAMVLAGLAAYVTGPRRG